MLDRTLLRVVAAACAILVAAPLRASAQCDMTLLNHYGGTTRCQAVLSNRMYAVYGDELFIYSISSQTPETPPTLLGRGFVRTDQVEDIEVDGTVVFLAGRASGLIAIDAATPAALVELDRMVWPGPIQNSAYDISIVGNRAYVEGCGSLLIVDISDPANLTELGQGLNANGSGLCTDNSIAVEGNTAFLATDTGVEIVDVTNAAAPVTLATYRPAIAFRHVAVFGGLLVADERDSTAVHLVDVQTPASPSRYSTIQQDADIFELGPWLDLLHARTPSGDVAIWDILNPASPQARGTIPTGELGAIIDVDAAGTLAIVGHPDGIELWSCANPNVPTEHWQTGVGHRTTEDIAADHKHAVVVYDVGFNQGRVRISDISQPGTALVIGELPLAENVNSVAIRDPHAFVAGDESFWVIDLAAPGGPQIVGSTVLDGFIYPRWIEITGDFAVILNDGGTHGVGVIDISDPAAPFLRGETPMSFFGENIRGFAVTGASAYVATHENTHAISLADPDALLLAYSLGVPSESVALSGNTLAIVVYNDGADNELRFYFAPDPLTAVFLGSYSENVFNPVKVHARGDLLAMFDDSGHQSHVSLLDISDPANASEVDRVQTNSNCSELVLTPDRIWRADLDSDGGDDSGFWEFGLPLPPEIVEQPASVCSCQPGFKQFHVDAGGAPTYRWRRDGVNLNNGPTGQGSIIAGAFSATLTIFAADADDNANYACVVTNGCGAVTSAAATLNICGVCPGDVNCDCRQDLADLATLLTHFGVAAGATREMGDLTGDGAVNLTDLATLLSVFGASCQ